MKRRSTNGCQFLPTLHACLRYSQRVLGNSSMDIDSLRADPGVLGRCSRGLQRLALDAEVVGIGRPGSKEGSVLLLKRTRALIVKGQRILTVIVSPRPEGFGKSLLRHYELSPLVATARGVVC